MKYLPKYYVDAYEIELFMLNFHMSKREFCKECKITMRELAKTLNNQYLNFKLNTLMRIVSFMDVEFHQLLSERKHKIP